MKIIMMTHSDCQIWPVFRVFKVALFILLMICAPGTLFCQSITISRNGNDVTNKHFTVEGKATDNDLSVYLVITNTADKAVQVKVRKTETSVVPGSLNSFCLGVCYAPAVKESVYPFSVAAGQSTKEGVFSLEYVPCGFAGKSVIQYDIFDIADPENNKVSITVDFICSPGTGQKNSLSESFETWPPAGWTFANVGFAFGWFQGRQINFPAGGRSVAATFGLWFFEAQDQWLISPEVTIARGDTLSFRVSAHMVYDDHLDIMVSQFGTEISSFTDCIGSFDFKSPNEYPWTNIKLDISKYEGKTIHIAWRETAGMGGSMLMIDMVRVGPEYGTDASLSKIDFSRYIPAGETNISGTLFNQGLHVINQVNITWQVDNGPGHTCQFSGLSVAGDQTYHFTCSDKYMATPGLHNLKVWISNVNGQESDENPDNDVLRYSFKSSSGIVPKVYLLEEFTASWCGSCPGFNKGVIDPLIEKYKGKIAFVKYQDDKYFIPEDRTRGDFYGGIGWVPYVFIDGIYHHELCDELEPEINLEYIDHLMASDDVKWAAAEIKSKHSINKLTKSIELYATLTPHFTGSVCKTFISVVEKTTTGNAASSHEEECHSVLMKMIPDAQGISMNFQDNIPNTIHLTADLKNTFIEEFSDLEVVVFVQDTNTKEVIQAAYSEETENITGTDDMNLPDKDVRIYPIPSKGQVYIRQGNISDGVIMKVYDLNGRLQKSDVLHESLNPVDLSDLSKGTYVVSLENQGEVKTKRLIIQ